MDNLIDQYVEIRDTLMKKVYEMVDVYLTGIWDPCMKYIIIKELNKLIVTELSRQFPDFPVNCLPHVKFKVFEDEMHIEAGVQIYLNTQSGLDYLGNIEHDGAYYDLYCRESWDPNFSHVFIARYGHSDDCFLKGSKQPAAEYMAGIMTPLSIAYSFAIDEGYIP